MTSDSCTFRMFVDDASGVALWSVDGAEELDVLPMSEDLRDRIQAWVDEYTDAIARGRSGSDAWALEHDQRGQALCEELREQVAPRFSVTYLPNTRELRESLRKSS